MTEPPTHDIHPLVFALRRRLTALSRHRPDRVAGDPAGIVGCEEGEWPISANSLMRCSACIPRRAGAPGGAG